MTDVNNSEPEKKEEDSPSSSKPVVEAASSAENNNSNDIDSNNVPQQTLTSAINTKRGSSSSPSRSGDFKAVLDWVDAFFRLQQQQSSSADQLLALSLLIPRLSPLQLSYLSAMAARFFDKVPYADGKKCDDLRAQAGDISYLNELYTRAFQADQVPDVLSELAQLLPVAQLTTPTIKNNQPNASSNLFNSSSDCAKLVHLYANMLMHCINRTDDVAMQRFVQALAVIQPDVRDHLIQTSNCGGLPVIVANGDINGEDGEEETATVHHRLPPKIIPPELMFPPFFNTVAPPQSIQRPQTHHSPIGACISLPASQPRDPSPNSDVTGNLPQQTSPIGTYHHPHHPMAQQSVAAFQQQQQHQQQQSQVGTPVMGSGSNLIVPTQRVLHPQPFHQAISRQRTMPEGASLATLVQSRQLSATPSQGGCVFVMEGSGMRDVPIWLKNLRLHKYTPLFEKMSYEEMLNLNEEWLESHKVTKGATNKIMQNIQKLRERQSQLRHFEKEIMQNPGVDVRAVLDSLHQMMNTPIKRYSPPLPPSSESSPQSATPETPPAPSSSPATPTDNMQWILGDDAVPEGDLPGQMTRLIGRLMCYFLIKPAALSEPSLLIHFIKLVDKCAQHEAFTDRHRTLLSQTKQRCQSFVHASQPPRSQWSPAGGGQAGNASPGSTGMGYRKPRGMQSELRASPSVPANMPGSRPNSSNAPNGVVGDGVGYQPNHPYNISPPNRNYWLEQQQQASSPGSGSNNGNGSGENGNQMPLGTSYSLRAAAAISPLVSGRPPLHSITPSSPCGSNSNVSTGTPSLDTFMPFNTPPATVSPTQLQQPVSQGPPGFTTKQFRPPALASGIVGAPLTKTPLGRTQSAPQTPPGGGAGGSLLMMSFGSRPQAWLAARANHGGSTSPTTGSSSTTGSGNFGPPGGHVPLSPQTSHSGSGGSGAHPNMMIEAEAFANSQLNTLCLQMTDVCLNAPDFSEQDDKFNEV